MLFTPHSGLHIHACRIGSESHAMVVSENESQSHRVPHLWLTVEATASGLELTQSFWLRERRGKAERVCGKTQEMADTQG